MIAMPKSNPLSNPWSSYSEGYLALWETAHSKMMIAMLKRSPLSKLPSPPTHRTMKVDYVGITLQMSINQFALAIWYPYYFSNNLNVWTLYSTIDKQSEEADALNLWNFACQNVQITGRIEDAHLCCRGEQKATWSNVSCQVCRRGRCIVRKDVPILTHWKNTRGRSLAPSIAQDLWKG